MHSTSQDSLPRKALELLLLLLDRIQREVFFSPSTSSRSLISNSPNAAVVEMRSSAVAEPARLYATHPP